MIDRHPAKTHRANTPKWAEAVESWPRTGHRWSGMHAPIDPFAARQDALTGLSSESAARHQVDFWAANVPDRPVLAMRVGFRHFSSINFVHGRTAGDRALQEAGRLLREFCERQFAADDAIVARISGSDFLVVTRTLMEAAEWERLACNLAEVLACPLAGPLGTDDTVAGERLWLVPRVFLAQSLAEPAFALFDRLDHACLRSNHRNGPRITWSDPPHPVHVLGPARLAGELAAALLHDQIDIRFQPQFDTMTGRLTGAEALARWQHPELGVIDADMLFAVAERVDMMPAVSRHIRARALHEAASWGVAKAGRAPIRLSLNVTAEDLAEADFAVVLRQQIADAGFAPQLLTLELTEKALIHNLTDSARMLDGLVADGIQIALDDFGSGFSNFGYLKALPVHCLKLDGSLVTDLGVDERDRAMVRAILAMARSLGLSVIAEGVERDEQLAVLKAEGCPLYQGFLGAPPLNGAEMRGLLG